MGPYHGRCRNAGGKINGSDHLIKRRLPHRSRRLPVLLTWLSLFEQECLYQIVTPGIPNADTANADDTLLLVSDNIERLDQRIRRILKKTAHVEFPHSQTSHMLTNIRVTQNAAGEIDVRNRFLTFRTKSDRTVQFFGHQIYKLTHRDGQLRIKLNENSGIKLDEFRERLRKLLPDMVAFAIVKMRLIK